MGRDTRAGRLLGFGDLSSLPSGLCYCNGSRRAGPTRCFATVLSGLMGGRFRRSSTISRADASGRRRMRTIYPSEVVPFGSMAAYSPSQSRLGDTAKMRQGWKLVMDLKRSGPERTNIASWMTPSLGRDLIPTFGSGVIGWHHLTDALYAAPPEGVITRVPNKLTHPLDRQVASEPASRTLVARGKAQLATLVSGQFRLAAAEDVMEADA